MRPQEPRNGNLTDPPEPLAGLEDAAALSERELLLRVEARSAEMLEGHKRLTADVRTLGGHVYSLNGTVEILAGKVDDLISVTRNQQSNTSKLRLELHTYRRELRSNRDKLESLSDITADVGGFVKSARARNKWLLTLGNKAVVGAVVAAAGIIGAGLAGWAIRDCAVHAAPAVPVPHAAP